MGEGGRRDYSSFHSAACWLLRFVNLPHNQWIFMQIAIALQLTTWQHSQLFCGILPPSTSCQNTGHENCARSGGHKSLSSSCRLFSGVGPLVYLVSSLEQAKKGEGCCKLWHGSVLKSTWQSDDICIIWQLFSNCNNNFSLIVLHAPRRSGKYSQCFNFHSFYYCPQKVLPPCLIIFLCLGRLPHTETFSIQL